MSDVTRILTAIEQGDAQASEELLPLVYNELRRMAAHKMASEPAGHTLQPTALVHEAWLQLVDAPNQSWQNRAHFFGVAAQMMRRILVDFARSRHYAKRGGETRQVSLSEAAVVSAERGEHFIALDYALESLTAIDARKGRIVELRFFGGLSVEETAEVLKISSRTVMREWSLAQAWLYRELSGVKR